MKKVFVLAILFLSPQFILAANINDSQVFNVEPTHDQTQREQSVATLRKLSNSAYFYIDDSWWLSLSPDQQTQVNNALSGLGEEFDTRIYPLLTQAFGDVWSPGIDKDTRITILLEPMKETSGGYINTGDEYPKTQFPKSNEKEMIYLSANQVTNSLLKSFLAHEFQHLITFNQKERLRGVVEDVWLNEARSEYALTYLGYDAIYASSNLERRVRSFLDKSYDSLTEWKNQPVDYGVTNLFIQYLVDHYGVDVLKESLASSKAGIESLNEALKKLNSPESFQQIFTNWTVASFINDCNLGSLYCYLNPSLRNFKVVPLANFLPPLPKTSLSVTNTTKNWSGNWYKFFGAKGKLTLDFTGSAQSISFFKIPYFLEDNRGKYAVNFLTLDLNQSGRIEVADFGKEYLSLVIVPSLQGKNSGFTDNETATQFSWTATAQTAEVAPVPNPAEIENLLAKIAELKNEIAKLQQKLAESRGQCAAFSKNLYYGLTNSADVRCLQEFLKSKGEAVYPEGLVTGNYLSATTLAVKRYQAVKSISQTGYFGPLTRTAANIDIKQ